MDKKRVSILIPVYNSEKWIGATIESVLRQTYDNIEIIIVDDGSSDRSLEIAESYVSEKVTVYHQENKGACAARNKALELASGDYINYLDADDEMDPGKIEAQIRIFEEYGDEIIASGSWSSFIKAPGDLEEIHYEVDKDYTEPIEWLIDSWNGKGMAACSAWLTPVELIKRAGAWDERLKINQDGEFFSRVLLEAREIKYCSGVKTYYRRNNEQSISAGSLQAAKSLFLSYQLYKEHVLAKRNDKEIKKALARNFQLLVYLYNRKLPDLARSAREEIKELGGHVKPVYGGRFFIALANTTSFEFAIWCRDLFRS